MAAELLKCTMLQIASINNFLKASVKAKQILVKGLNVYYE